MANLLAIYSGGSLYDRISSHQIRCDEPCGSRIFQVTGLEPLELVYQGTMEPSNVVAWLESLGIAHTNL